MSKTQHFNLLLTGATETSMTFFEWRTLMNGEGDNSNMKLIDAALHELDEKAKGRANGFTFNPDTGVLQLTADGVNIEGASDVIDLSNYYKKDEADEVIDRRLSDYYNKDEADEIVDQNIRPNAVGSLSWDEGNRQLTAYNMDGVQLGEPVTIEGGGGGGSSTAYYVRVFNNMASTNLRYANGQPCELSFYFTEMFGQDQTPVDGNAVISYSVDNTNYVPISTLTGLKQYIPGDASSIHRIDVTDRLIVGTNYFKVLVTGGEGNTTKSITYTITVVDCFVVSNFNADLTYTNNISYQYSCVGRGLNKTVYFYVDGSETPTYSYAYGTTSATTGQAVEQVIDVSGWEHGSHTLEVFFVTDDGVQSPHLYYDIMYSTGSTVPLVSAVCDVEAVTYGDVITLPYRVFTENNSGVTTTVTRTIYGMPNGQRVNYVSYTDSNVQNNVTLNWVITFAGAGFPPSGTVYVEIAAGASSTPKTFAIEVGALGSEYDLNATNRRLVAALTAAGKSNNGVDRSEWNASYTTTDGVTTTIETELKDFNYSSNGWCTDNEGHSYLRISGNAKATVKLPLFAASYKDKKNQTVEFNGSVQEVGRTFEIECNIHNVTDTNAVIVSCFKTVSETAAELKGAGIRIYPKHAVMLNNSQTLEYDNDGNIKNPQAVAVSFFNNDSRVRMSFVVEGADGSETGKQAMKMYLNGELYRVVSYDTTSTFDTGSEGDTTRYITIGDNSCIIDIYSMRFYDTYLSEEEILQNYIADKDTIQEKIAIYEENDVLNASAAGRGEEGDTNYDDMLDYYACRTKLPCILVTGKLSPEKGTKTTVGLYFTKPDSSDENGYRVEVDGNEQLDGKYLCQTNVQGTTSSQLYPRYNYKFTFNKIVDGKKKKHKYKLKPGTDIGEDTLCWKADMMSPDHANTVNAVWFPDLFVDPTPPQEENPNVQTMIYGYRCLLFQRDDEDANITFKGDGCLNNDKGNSSTFGLENDCDTDATDAFWTESGTTVSNYTITEDGEEEVVAVLDAEGDVTTRCQKWEYLDNSPAICSFKGDDLMRVVYDDKNQPYYNFIDALESTYPDQGDLEDYGLAPNCTHIQLLYLWVYKRANFWTASADGFADGAVSKMYAGVTYTNERAYRKAIFLAEFDKHLNKSHVLSYYIALQVVALIDNRAKNMFMSCYDTLADKVVFTSTATRAGVTSLHKMMEYAAENDGNIPENFIDWDKSEFAIWYPTLYDLDSCYGVDNKGYKWIPYYADWLYHKWGDEENQGYIFNGAESYLWLMVEEALISDIKTRFNKLANDTPVLLSTGETANALSYANWYDKMVTQNIDTVCARITTEDSIFKYGMPWTVGYTKGAAGTVYPPTAEFLYLIQGNKKYADCDFMQRRLNLLYSFYESTPFLGDTLMILLPAGNFTHEDVALTMTPVQNMHCKVRFDTQLSFTGKLTEEGVPVTVSPADTTRNYGEATITIAGATLLSKIDGLHKLKGSSYNLGNAINLRELQIGSTEAGYVNGTTTALTLTSCSLLEKLNIANCTALTTIDVSPCPLIEEIEATGCSQLSAVTLPVGGYLTKLHLPASITDLTVRDHGSITDFSLAGYNNIQTLWVENDNNKIPTKAILQARGTNLLKLKLVGINWNLGDDDTVLHILADNAMYGKQISATGSAVNGYPVVSGTIRVSNVNAEMLSVLNTRYPSLNIISTAQTHTVTFKNYNGAVLHTEEVAHNGSANDPIKSGAITTPTRPKSQQYTYTYNGWDVPLNNVREPRTVTATYSTTVNQYTISFYDANGNSVLMSKTVDYGTTVKYSGVSPITTVRAYKPTKDTAFIAGKTYYSFSGSSFTQITVVEEDDGNLSSTRVLAGTKMAAATYYEGYGKALDGNGKGNVFVGEWAGVKTVDGKNSFIEDTYESTVVYGTTKMFPQFMTIETPGEVTSFDACTEGEIASICQDGLADKWWAVGDERNVVLSTGETIVQKIYGFKHDKDRSGNLIPVTTGMENLMKDTRKMNSATKRDYNYTINGTAATSNDMSYAYTGSATSIDLVATGITWITSITVVGTETTTWYFDGSKEEHSFTGNVYDKLVWDGLTMTGSIKYNPDAGNDAGGFTELVKDSKIAIPVQDGATVTISTVTGSSWNAGGWYMSELRTWGNDTFYKSMPAATRNCIVPAVKSATTGNMTTKMKTAADKIWTFSLSEVNCSKSSPYNLEGTAYPIFTDNASRVKYLDNGNGDPYYWWLRSPDTGNASAFWYVGTDGTYYNRAALTSCGVCFGFCVSRPVDLYKVYSLNGNKVNQNISLACPKSMATLAPFTHVMEFNIKNLSSGFTIANLMYSGNKGYSVHCSDAGILTVNGTAINDVALTTGKNYTLVARIGANGTVNKANPAAFMLLEEGNLRNCMYGYVDYNTSGSASLSIGHANCTISKFDVYRKVLTPVEINDAYNFNIPEDGTETNAKYLTWAQIKALGTDGYVNTTSGSANNGKWCTKNGTVEHAWFDKGDTKDITLTNGTVQTLVFADFNHDTDEDGNTLPFTFVTAHLYKNTNNKHYPEAHTIMNYTLRHYVLTSDATFASGKTYYKYANGAFSAAVVTAGNSVAAGTYYELDATTAYTNDAEFTATKAEKIVLTTTGDTYLASMTLANSAMTKKWLFDGTTGTNDATNTYYTYSGTTNAANTAWSGLVLNGYPSGSTPGVIEKTGGFTDVEPSCSIVIDVASGDTLTVTGYASYNIGGYKHSDYRAWLNETMYPLLPAYVKSVITAAKKPATIGGLSSKLDELYENIWALSISEVSNTTSGAYGQEGKQYPIFTDNASRIKKQFNGTGSASWWWLRSPYAGRTGYFWSVFTDGGYDHSGAYGSSGVCFGFCV